MRKTVVAETGEGLVTSVSDLLLFNSMGVTSAMTALWLNIVSITATKKSYVDFIPSSGTIKPISGDELKSAN